MPDALDGFQPILTDDALAKLDAQIQTLDPARADAARVAVLQAAKDARSGKDFLSMATKIIGGILAF